MEFSGIKTAVIYCRFSPRRDAEKCTSIEKQADSCRKMCDVKNWHVLQEFADRAKSGATADNRPGLQAAMDMAIKHKAVLVVHSLSRFCRSLKDAIVLSDQLNKSGCNLASVSEHVDTTTPMGRAFFSFIAVVNQLERELTAERTSTAMKYAISQNRYVGGKLPFGFEFHPEIPGKVIENEYQQALLEQVKSFYGSTKKKMSNMDVCRWLNARGLRCPRGKEWKSSTNYRQIVAALDREGFERPGHAGRVVAARSE